MYCKRCGARLSQGTVICPECGARQRRLMQSVRCAHCRRRSPVELRLCPYCGRHMKPPGPRWGLWFLGTAALVLICLWGVRRLPVRAATQDMSHLQDGLMELVELPELPSGTGVPAGSSGPATPGAVTTSLITAPITTALSLTQPVPSGTNEPFSTTLASAQGSDTLAAAVATAIAGPTAPTPLATAATSSPPTTPSTTTTPTATSAATSTATATPAATSTATAASAATSTATTTPAATSTATAITSSTSVTPTATPAITSSTSLTLTATPAITSTAIAVAAQLTPTSVALARTPAPTAQAARYYTVQPGDTLIEIGVATGTDWEQIEALNGITDQTPLQLGQQLRLPAPEPSQPTPTTAAGKMTTYQVQSGDTLGSIGVRFGMDSQTIAQANGLDVDAMLQVGQELQIPAPSGQP